MSDLRTYAIVSAGYWGFTLTDGALRMLVLLHFHTLGYTPVELAMLFVLYEIAGVVTNLIGGWIAARLGVKSTLLTGLAMQVAALGALALLSEDWTRTAQVAFVLVVQGASGIAKDFTKVSAKSAIKLVVAEEESGRLYRWVALLTGSKNTLKGVGFFLGGALLAWLGFEPALWAMAGGLALTFLVCGALLPRELGRAKSKLPFRALLSKTRAINLLSAARFFLFGARDIWFVVGLPVFLYDVLGWSFVEVGTYLAAWVIGYGFVQTATPRVTRGTPRAAQVWAFLLAVVPLGIYGALRAEASTEIVVVGGLAVFGIAFAINSAVHSYLILAYAEADKTAMDVGFYYMANAGGRLVGTVLSGVIYEWAGLTGCLLAAAGMVALSGSLSLALPALPRGSPKSEAESAVDRP